MTRTKTVALASPVNEETRIKQSKLDYLDIFWDSNSSVAVVELSDNHTGISHDDRVELKANDNEERLVWNILNNPSTDLAIIRRRQNVFRTLLAEQVNIDQLMVPKNLALELKPTLKKLLKVSWREEERAKETGSGPRCRLEVCLDTVPCRLEGTRIIPACELEERSDEFETIEAFNSLSQLITAGKRLAERLDRLPNRILKNIAGNILAEIDTIHLRSAAQKALKKDYSELNEIYSIVAALDYTLEKLGAVLAIAELAKRDHYIFVTFDETRPEVFKQAWNLRHKKENKWSPEKSQVKNNAPADTQATVVTGDMMTGKSRLGDTIVSGRKCAQAIGLFPGEGECNLHILSAIATVDRSLTNNNNLSAYGKDVENLQNVIGLFEKVKGGRVLLVTDEWGSTTSPEDQSVILEASSDVLAGKGVKMHISTHNDLFVERIRGNGRYTIYHMATEHGEDGKVTFCYKLIPGTAESLIIDIAKQMGLPERIIELARLYLKGEAPAVSIPEQKINRIIRYSEAERTRMKAETKGFMSIMPWSDELVPFAVERVVDVLDKRKPEFNRFFYRYGAMSGEDYESNGYRQFKPEKKPKWPQFDLTISDSRDRHWQLFKDPVSYFSEEIASLHKHGATADSRVVLERQQMFDQIMKQNEYRKFEQTATGVSGLLYHFSNTAGSGFNRELTRFNEYMLETTYHYLGNRNNMKSKEVDFFEICIRINGQLLGLDLDRLGIEPLLQKTKQLLIIRREFKNLDYEYGWGDNKEYIQVRRAQIRSLQEQYDRTKVCDPEEAFTYEDAINDNLLQLIRDIYAKVAPHINPISMCGLDLGEAALVFDKYRERIEAAASDCGFFNDGLRMADYLITLLDDTPYPQQLLKMLRACDSVYLHQLANYFETIFSLFFGQYRTGRDYLTQTTLNLNDDKPNAGYRSNRNQFWGFDSFEKIQKELRKLLIIYAYAEFMRTENYCKVEFNETGQITLTEATDPSRLRKDMVPNNYSFNDPQGIVNSERSKILSGYNMSGKSTAKHVIARFVRSAHTTGFAPAEYATMPFINGTVNIDRTKANTAEGLSAGGTETVNRIKVAEFIADKGLVFIADDETYSTVPPRYQSALTAAFNHWVVEQGHFYVVAHHNHQYIGTMLENNPTSFAAYHFAVSRDLLGKLLFDHKVRPGHQLSHAIEVAASLDSKEKLLQQVIERARELEVIYRSSKTAR